MGLTEMLQKPQVLIIAALFLDLLFGDPIYRMHPIRLIGRLLSALENGLRRAGLSGYGGGFALFVLLAGITLGVVVGISMVCRQIHPYLHFLWRLYIVWSMIALGDLCKHGKHIAAAVRYGDLELARKCTGLLVGRDLDKMDEHDCCRAGVESLSENLTDGVISPLFYFFLFGIPGLVLFKVVSTMDSMVGYRNKKYAKFGWCGARFDDVLNYIPARLTWLLMCIIALLLPGYSVKGCIRVALKQHSVLPGPNSGWSEAAAAGALGLQLVGPIWSGGRLVTELWLGDETARRETYPGDILRMILFANAVTMAFVVLGCVAIPWLGGVMPLVWHV